MTSKQQTEVVKNFRTYNSIMFFYPKHVKFKCQDSPVFLYRSAFPVEFKESNKKIYEIRNRASAINPISKFSFLPIIYLHPPLLVLHEWIALISELSVGQFFLVRQRKAVLELALDSYCLQFTVYQKRQRWQYRQNQRYLSTTACRQNHCHLSCEYLTVTIVGHLGNKITKLFEFWGF